MKQLIDLEYDEVIHETEKAILFDFGEKEAWIPKSIAEVDRDNRIVTVPTSWAVREELDAFAV